MATLLRRCGLAAPAVILAGLTVSGADPIRVPVQTASARTGSEQIEGLVAGAGRMAHTSTGPYLPLDAAPMRVGDPAALADGVAPVAGRPLTFRAPGIRVDERAVASVAVDGRQPDRFTAATYVVPADVIAADADGVLSVRFVAEPESRAGAVYDIRLARPE